MKSEKLDQTNNPTTKQPDPEIIKILYDENGENNRYLIEWRHKIVVRFFIAIAAFLYLSKWLWEIKDPPLRKWSFIPFLLITLLSMVIYIMDKRDRRFMDVCARVGSDLEDKLGLGTGFYSEYLKLNTEKDGKIRRPFISFTTAIELIYLGTAILSFIIALCLFVTILY